jgi:UDP-N-acetylglucosamine 4-epimerase
MMVERYGALRGRLAGERHRFLVTGVAGFIGSALLETLLALDQEVVGLDNFMTGKRSNLTDVEGRVAREQWARFTLIEGDLRDRSACEKACAGAEVVLHQAALGSVPRSIEDPLLTHACNLDGFLNMLVAARDAGVRRFVYAASSSTYGDSPTLPKREDVIGRPLSPYAVTKYVNELYADVFARCYGVSAIGLRYFNVFGRRQDPDGAYAAVIPLWFASMLRAQPVHINGDGETSRDFCYIDNVVQANLLAGFASGDVPSVFNVAVGEQTTLNQLFYLIRDHVSKRRPELAASEPVYRAFRAGDVRHSLADVGLAREHLGYEPVTAVRAGLEAAAEWYLGRLS